MYPDVGGQWTLYFILAHFPFTYLLDGVVSPVLHLQSPGCHVMMLHCTVKVWVGAADRSPVILAWQILSETG